MTKLQNKFKEEIVPSLQKQLGVKNPMSVPKLSKIVVNMGVKDVLLDKKRLSIAAQALAIITGQKPKETRAKKSISSFKLREGDKIGLVVTLRGKRMYDFFEKLTTMVLPRLRDFYGVSTKSFDGKGNYTLGFTECTVFPEIDPGKVDALLLGQGFEVTITTTAKDNEEGFILLEVLGMPFKKVKS